MATARKARKNKTEGIDPQRLYPLEAFKRDSGLGHNSIRKARDKGIDLPMIQVGRRKYVEGEAGIRFIVQAATA